MPSITYTADQQARMTAAQKAVDVAQYALNNAQANQTNLYNAMANAFADGSLASGVYSLPGDHSLSSQLSVGLMDSNSCKRDAWTGLLKSSKCPSAVSTFNQSYINWQGSSAGVTSAQTALATAKAAQKTLLDAIALEVANDPNVIANTAAAVAAQNIQRTKWILFGLIALSVVVVAIFFSKTLLSKSA